MKNPKIKIESDGITAIVYLDGKEIPCTSIDFHGDVENGLYIEWHGTMVKRDENGITCVENDEVVTEEFHYDSRKVGDSDA